MPIGVQIELRGLAVGYRGSPILEAIDLELPAGSKVAFVGSNGCGKSTLLRTIAAAQLPVGGNLDYSIESQEVDRRSLPKYLGYVPQHGGVLSHLSVVDYLRYVAWLKKLSKAESNIAVSQVQRDFELQKLGNETIKKLSGGTIRRVLVAQAFLNGPRLLILDEPDTGFDDVFTQLLLDQISKYPEMTVLMATQNRFIAESFQFTKIDIRKDLCKNKEFLS